MTTDQVGKETEASPRPTFAPPRPVDRTERLSECSNAEVPLHGRQIVARVEHARRAAPSQIVGGERLDARLDRTALADREDTLRGNAPAAEFPMSAHGNELGAFVTATDSQPVSHRLARTVTEKHDAVFVSLACANAALAGLRDPVTGIETQKP